MIFFLLTLQGEIHHLSLTDQETFEWHIVKHNGILRVSAPSHRWLWPAWRPPRSQTLRVTGDVKCPVLNTAWALGLMVQGKVLLLPPRSPGHRDGSGHLPALPNPQLPSAQAAAAAVPAKQVNTWYEQGLSSCSRTQRKNAVTHSGLRVLTCLCVVIAVAKISSYFSDHISSCVMLWHSHCWAKVLASSVKSRGALYWKNVILHK